jgi:hypothetical protein
MPFTETFLAENARLTITACDPQPTKFNFFFGTDQSKWRSNISSFSEIIYHNVWPGIDVRFIAKAGDVEQEFVIHAGADPALIQVAYEGIQELRTLVDGSLSAVTAFGVLKERTLVVFQDIDGHRVTRRGSFIVRNHTTYAFALGPFDRGVDLVIDPALLYSTFLGGTALDWAFAIAADTSGDAFVAGITGSPDFPITSGAFHQTRNELLR